MKVILSRKGFDSSYGGCPSPIFPDGTMLSMPIPSDIGNCSYDELVIGNEKSYAQIWQELAPNSKHSQNCHLDPDLRKNIKPNRPTDWKAAFGQTAAAQSHLESHKVGIGDLFLFFGWFRKVEYIKNKLSYVKEPSFQAIYGYMQIGEILKGEDIKKCPWHPHSDDVHVYKKNGTLTNNAIYISSDNLIIDGQNTGLSGFGTFSFSEDKVLTKRGCSRSQWKLNDVFGKVPLTYHSESSVKDGYFQSAKRGQEFIFDEDTRVINWAKNIIGVESAY